MKITIFFISSNIGDTKLCKFQGGGCPDPPPPSRSAHAVDYMYNVYAYINCQVTFTLLHLYCDTLKNQDTTAGTITLLNLNFNLRGDIISPTFYTRDQVWIQELEGAPCIDKGPKNALDPNDCRKMFKKI